MPILGIMASQISGHLWAPEGAYDSLATVTLSTSANIITFAGIPAGYKHLQLRYLSRSTRASGSDSVSFRFNSDSGSNYARHVLYGDGASAGAVATASDTLINCGLGAGASAGASMFGGGVVDILDYTSTVKNKTIRTLTGVDINGSGGDLRLGSGLWFATPAAITSITLYANGGSSDFVTYSSFALYGVK
jgi:hypothetical protein